jgi:hypothetical protein
MILRDNKRHNSVGLSLYRESVTTFSSYQLIHLEKVVIAETEKERVGPAVAMRSRHFEGMCLQTPNEIRTQPLPLPGHLLVHALKGLF